MKNIQLLRREINNKTMSIEEIDNYMTNSGYNSILPADAKVIDKSGLIWYPFEPFLNQINIWVDNAEDNKYFIREIEHFKDC